MKLEIELVPDSCWQSNLRSILPPKLWDVVRRDAYERAGGKCSICGASGRLEAHEKWSYDDKKCVQRLVDVVAVCRACHETIHIGRTTLAGREKEAADHFMKVNKCSYADYRKALGEANEKNIERGKKEWALDLGWLNRFT